MPIVNHVKTHAHEHIRNLQFTLFTLETFTRLHKGSEWVGGYSGLFHKGSFSPINFFYELLNKFFSIKNVKVLFDYYSDSEKSSTKSSKQHKKTDSRRPTTPHRAKLSLGKTILNTSSYVLAKCTCMPSLIKSCSSVKSFSFSNGSIIVLIPERLAFRRQALFKF